MYEVRKVKLEQYIGTIGKQKANDDGRCQVLDGTISKVSVVVFV